MNALIEYFKKEANYKLKLRDLESVNEQRNAVRKEYDLLRKQRLEMFLEGFGQISLKLKEMYQMITLGGDAELELIDSLDPFSEGVSFSVRPPKKSWKQISNLSGGEKTLSSLALVFALHYYRPTPLYVMDEIDAALVSLFKYLFSKPPIMTVLLLPVRFRISKMFPLWRTTSRKELRMLSSSLSP
jgi:structural maintenance of chromosome 4